MMDSPYPYAAASFVAGFLTYCDLDAVFDAPPHSLSWGSWTRFKFWWWGFILANAALASCLLYFLIDLGYFKSSNKWFAASMVGAGYSALVRLKLTTVSINDAEVPLGLETFYEALKSLIHKRINVIVRDWRIDQSQILAQSDIAALRERCLILVMGDVLMNQEQRQLTNVWIEQVVGAADLEDLQRRYLLAMYIVSGQKRPV